MFVVAPISVVYVVLGGVLSVRFRKLFFAYNCRVVRRRLENIVAPRSVWTDDSYM